MGATSRQATTVKTMKELGYSCDKGIWTSSPEAVAHLANEAIERYEAERWPDGKIPGGKG
jgi:hypothetical protein